MQSDKAHKINVHLVGWDGVGRVSEKPCFKDKLLPEEAVRGGRKAAERQRVQRPRRKIKRFLELQVIKLGRRIGDEGRGVEE